MPATCFAPNSTLGRAIKPWGILLLLLLLAVALGVAVLAVKRKLPVPHKLPALSAMAELDGLYRNDRVLLRLRWHAPQLWARTGDSRWERLVPLAPDRLRAATLGYEVELLPGLEQVQLRLAGDPVQRLQRALIPLVNGQPTTPYLRGSMNDWDTRAPMFASSGSRYSVDLQLSAGTHEFKIGSADWFTIDLGGDSNQGQVHEGDDVPLLPVGSNLILRIDETGRYRFVLDLHEPERPRVQVRKLP